VFRQRLCGVLLVRPWWARAKSYLGLVTSSLSWAAVQPQHPTQASQTKPNWNQGKRDEAPRDQSIGWGSREGLRKKDGLRPVPRGCGGRRSWQRAIGRVEDLCSPDGRTVLERRVHRAQASGRKGLAEGVVVDQAVVRLQQGVGNAAGWWRPRTLGCSGVQVERGARLSRTAR
jgi:hypothetical protein